MHVATQKNHVDLIDTPMLCLLKQARAWFLKIDIVRTSVCVVCPWAIKNYSREMIQMKSE